MNYIVTRDPEDLSPEAVATAMKEARNSHFHHLMAQISAHRQRMREGQAAETNQEYGRRIGVPSHAIQRADWLAKRYLAGERDLQSPLYPAYALIAMAIDAGLIAALQQMPMPVLGAVQPVEVKIQKAQKRRQRVHKEKKHD